MINSLKSSFNIFLLALSSSLIFVFSCNHSNIIEEQKFIQIYTDIIIASDTASAGVQGSEITAEVCRSYGVAVEDYKATLDHYNQDSEGWEKFFKEAAVYHEQKRKSSSK